MEGDTPAFLNLLPNGLESYRHPSWGGWGGRYVYRQPYGETRSVWTQGGDLFGRVNSGDTVTGIDGLEHTSDQATIWRWRGAFQNDFAARMDWTHKPYRQANHPPVARLARWEGASGVDGADGRGVVELELAAGASVALDAGGSSDPDGDRLDYNWFLYGEAGGPPAGSARSAGRVGMADVRVVADGARATLRAVATCRPSWLDVAPCPATGTAHVILAVTDNGQPALTTYRRVVVRVTGAARAVAPAAQ